MASTSSSSTLDSSKFSQVGRYGTISLMKRQEPDTVITSFGVDTEELTFGRDPSCGVRLYYPDVSLVHCKIVFEERKAFLVVLGAQGLIIDGCQVYPNDSNSLSTPPMTIPLINNSEFEIRAKRFRFTYPPKEMRPILLATPAPVSHRKLRLSMIQSAQVFSPRPSKDPRENLRILKSPLKNVFKSPIKRECSSPLKTNIFSATRGASPHTYRPPMPQLQEQDDEKEEEDIVLVEGNHPRVVEEDKDLVILEDVEDKPLRPPSPQKAPAFPAPPYNTHPPLLAPAPQYAAPPQTPVRRAQSRNTLHRAVLIRSAQRAILKAELDEREREIEEEEEREVLDVVASETDSREGIEDRTDEVEDIEMGDVSDPEEEDTDEELNDDEDRHSAQKYSWRKSLERIWPFSSNSREPEDDEEAKPSEEEAGDHSEPKDEDQSYEEADDQATELPSLAPPKTPVRRPLGSFMTPQMPSRSLFTTSSAAKSTSAEAGRFSLGGVEARRVLRSDQVWKVKDIVIPPPVPPGSTIPGGADESHTGPGVPGPLATPSRRQTIDEEERRAIQERRRSALREAGSFFPGGVPGMGPSPAKNLAQQSPSKTSSSSSSISSLSSLTTSPSKPSPVKPYITTGRDSDEDELDTRSLLDRMKETVEGMKRRRSLAPGPLGTPSPVKVQFRVEPPSSPIKYACDGTPSQLATQKSAPENEEGIVQPEDFKAEKGGNGDNEDDKNHNTAHGAEEAFSLLRPGVTEEIRAKETTLVTITPPDEDAGEEHIVSPLVNLESRSEVQSTKRPDQLDIPKKAGRARLLRGRKASPSPIRSPQPESDDEVQVTRPLRRRTRQTTGQTEETVEERTSDSEDHHEAEQPLPPKPATRRGRKPTAESDVETSTAAAEASVPMRRGRKAAGSEKVATALAGGTTGRRGRKPTAEVVTEVEAPAPTPAATAAPTRRGRRAAATSPTTQLGGTDEEVVAPVAAMKRGNQARKDIPAAEMSSEDAAPVRRGRTPKSAPSTIPGRRPVVIVKEASTTGPRRTGRTRTAGAPPDDHPDPLDAIGEDEIVEAPAPKTAAKGRKKVIEEKVEDNAASEKAPTAKPVRSRSASASTTAVATTAKTPATTKTRGTRKTPATAPSAMQQGVDKENTPGSEESHESEESVKVRVSRTTRRTAATGATRTRVKQEEADEEPESKGKVVRVTRTRTRTRT